jgi:16S rRNA processing protein RimM
LELVKLVAIARLTRPRGNKGELVAFPLSKQPGRVKSVFVNEKPMEVERTWMHGDDLILKFRGVDTISDAEKLAGAEVAIPFEQRAALGEDEYYESDLIGCEVFDSTGRSLGRVTYFAQNGGTSLLHVGDLLIPFAKSICVEIDPANQRIVVNLPDGLLTLNLPDQPTAN